MEQKERFLDEIKYAPNFEQVEFYNRQIAILDKLINDLNLDLQRSALSSEYINMVKDMDAKDIADTRRREIDIADTRRLEIVKNILGKPPAIAPELANKIKTNLKSGVALALPIMEKYLEKEREQKKRNEAQQSIAGAMRQRLARREVVALYQLHQAQF